MEPKHVDVDYMKKFCDHHGGYFKAFNEVKLVKVGNGTVIAELEVKKSHLNAGKTLHGGFISSLIDNYNCMALFSHKNCAALTNVTIDMHITYINPAKPGDTIVIHSHAIKAGRTLGFVECEVRNKATGELLSTGNSNIFILRPKL